jgi:hypothetical protein
MDSNATNRQTRGEPAAEKPSPAKPSQGGYGHKSSTGGSTRPQGAGSQSMPHSTEDSGPELEGAELAEGGQPDGPGDSERTKVRAEKKPA